MTFHWLLLTKARVVGKYMNWWKYCENNAESINQIQSFDEDLIKNDVVDLD